jgi:hypothetical protein
MNFLNGQPIPWDSNDAQILKDFLQSDVGARALACVANDAPTLMDGKDVNMTLVRNGEVKGFTTAVQSLFRLCHEQPEQPKPTENYPDLDDEKAWSGGGEASVDIKT